MRMCLVFALVLSSTTAFAQADALAVPHVELAEAAAPSDEGVDLLADTATFLYASAIALRIGGIAASVAFAFAFTDCDNRTFDPCMEWFGAMVAAAALSTSAPALLVPATRVDIHRRRRTGDISLAPAVSPNAAALVVSGRF